MDRSKRIEIKPIDETLIYNFQTEINQIMSLGTTETQAGCYLSNYHDDYICDTYNGGCKSKSDCKMIYNKLRVEESI